MPLAFESRSHGTIAFGFFNIQSDMLLLDELFFFADHWCKAVVELARSTSPRPTAELSGWRIQDRPSIGDLHGAIAGIEYSGFIGATYRKWPFPQRQSGFKQSPEGDETQGDIEAMIEPFGERLSIVLNWDRAKGFVSLDGYRFTDSQFSDLVAYVDRGGYPRWRDDARPPYVREMVGELRRLKSCFAERIEKV